MNQKEHVELIMAQTTLQHSKYEMGHSDLYMVSYGSGLLEIDVSNNEISLLDHRKEGKKISFSKNKLHINAQALLEIIKAKQKGNQK